MYFIDVFLLPSIVIESNAICSVTKKISYNAMQSIEYKFNLLNYAHLKSLKSNFVGLYQQLMTLCEYDYDLVWGSGLAYDYGYDYDYDLVCGCDCDHYFNMFINY